MHLYLKENKWIPFFAIAILVVRTSVSLNMFPSLIMFSYAALGMCIINFLFFIILYLKERKVTVFGISVFLYYTLLFAFSVINNTDFTYAFYSTVEVLLLLTIFALYKEHISIVIVSFAAIFSLSVYVNLAIMILYPTWMFEAKDVSQSFLLGGNYNQMGVRLLCGAVTSVIAIKYSKWWLLNTIILFIVAFVTLAIVTSMTSLANLIVFGLFCLIPSLLLRKIAIFSLFVVFILFQIFIVFYGEGIQQNEFAVYIIEDVLNKDLTFTGRTYLWERSGILFSESPIIGYGFMNEDWFLEHISAKALGPHNFIYSVLLEGGIVLFAQYIFICVVALKKFVRQFDALASYILMAIVVLMFMMVMEVFSTFYVIFLLTLAYYYKDIKESFVKNKPDMMVRDV